LLDDRRIRIREAQIHVDPMDPEHPKRGTTSSLNFSANDDPDIFYEITQEQLFSETGCLFGLFSQQQCSGSVNISCGSLTTVPDLGGKISY
jgi:hypothetical protein